MPIISAALPTLLRVMAASNTHYEVPASVDDAKRPTIAWAIGVRYVLGSETLHASVITEDAINTFSYTKLSVLRRTRR